MWSGFKLVEGRSIRRYTNEGDVASAVIDTIGTRNKIHILHRNDKRAPPAMIN
jgi:hypothetical protein